VEVGQEVEVSVCAGPPDVEGPAAVVIKVEVVREAGEIVVGPVREGFDGGALLDLVAGGDGGLNVRVLQEPGGGVLGVAVACVARRPDFAAVGDAEVGFYESAAF
jgi:hypothetical protein